MEMITEIYKNNIKVNEIKTIEPLEIYKKITNIYYCKDNKLATKTTIRTGWHSIKEATQIFDQTKTQTPNITYKYKYTFKDVEI